MPRHRARPILLPRLTATAVAASLLTATGPLVAGAATSEPHVAKVAAVRERGDAVVRAAAALTGAEAAEDATLEPAGPLSALSAAVAQVAAARAAGTLPELTAAIEDAEKHLFEVAQSAVAQAAARATDEDRSLLDEETIAPLDDAAGTVRAAVRSGDVAAAALAAVRAGGHAGVVQQAAQAQRERIAGEQAAAAEVAAHEQRVAWSTSLDGFGNGHVPLELMVELTWAPGERLRADAAEALEALNAAYREAFGVDLSITDSYRSYDRQLAAKAELGRLAAPPGTSPHGLGIAVDLGGGVQWFDAAQHQWVAANGPAFGWHHPDWADPNGALPEAWHFEFVSPVNPAHHQR